MTAVPTTAVRVASAPHALRRWSIAAAAVTAAACGYVYARDPYEDTLSLPCAVLATTGLYCPLCGGTRAVHSLMHGDVGTAMSMNPFALFVIVPLGVLFIVAAWLGPQARLLRFIASVRTAYVVLGIGVVFTLARNVPILAPHLAP